MHKQYKKLFELTAHVKFKVTFADVLPLLDSWKFKHKGKKKLGPKTRYWKWKPISIVKETL